jgi:hypothetical protein
VLAHPQISAKARTGNNAFFITTSFKAGDELGHFIPQTLPWFSPVSVQRAFCHDP